MGHNSGSANQKLETFHLSYIKSTLGLRTQTSTDVVLTDTGHFPLQLRRNLNVIKYWLRMTNLQVDDPLCNAFNNIVQLHTLGQSNWWTEVITLLASLEISDSETLESTSMDEKDKLFATLKEKVYATHIESCLSRVKSDTEGKLRTFQSFKQDYCIEGYLLYLPNLKYISALARFRMSSPRLAIETGRHAKPKEERKCRNCS